MKTLTRKEQMYSKIRQHGENLNAIFNTGIEPIALCKKLRRLETKAHKLATDYCNGDNGVNSDNWDKLCQPILDAVDKILHSELIDGNIFINGDARGYALKLEEGAKTFNIYKDFGGYGIIAPDFNN